MPKKGDQLSELDYFPADVAGLKFDKSILTPPYPSLDYASSTFTRCCTCLIIPLVASLSGSSTVL